MHRNNPRHTLYELSRNAGTFKSILDKYGIDAFRDVHPFLNKKLSSGSDNPSDSDYLLISQRSIPKEYIFNYYTMGQRKHFPSIQVFTLNDEMLMFFYCRTDVEGCIPAIPVQLQTGNISNVVKGTHLKKSISVLKEKLDFLSGLSSPR